MKKIFLFHTLLYIYVLIRNVIYDYEESHYYYVEIHYFIIGLYGYSALPLL